MTDVISQGAGYVSVSGSTLNVNIASGTVSANVSGNWIVVSSGAIAASASGNWVVVSSGAIAASASGNWVVVSSGAIAASASGNWVTIASGGVNVLSGSVATSTSGNWIVVSSGAITTSVSGNIIQQSVYGVPSVVFVSSGLDISASTSGAVGPNRALTMGQVVIGNVSLANATVWVYTSGVSCLSGQGIPISNGGSNQTLEGISNTNLLRFGASATSGAVSIYGA